MREVARINFQTFREYQESEFLFALYSAISYGANERWFQNSYLKMKPFYSILVLNLVLPLISGEFCDKDDQICNDRNRNCKPFKQPGPNEKSVLFAHAYGRLGNQVVKNSTVYI